MAGPLGKQLGVVVFMPAPQEKLDRVRHSEGRSQTGWARAAKPMSQDWEALAEPPCSFLSREDSRDARGERLDKGTDA